jgi:CHAD domain-containing protein
MLQLPLPTRPSTPEAKGMAGELERVRKALRELGKSLKSLRRAPLPKDVHKLRTAARRAEAIAAALPSGHQKKSRRLLKAIEPVRKAAGGVRDMDVLMTNVRRLARHHAGDSLTRLSEHLQIARQQNAAELLRALHRESKTVRGQLKEYSKLVRTALAPAKSAANGAAQIALAHGRVNTVAMNIVRELEAWPALDESNVHEFRLKVKELRYILQLYAEADQEFVDKLGEVQRLVGAWHDWFQLNEIAREVLNPEKDAALLAHIAGTAQRKLIRALKSANALRGRHLAMPFAPGA